MVGKQSRSLTSKCSSFGAFPAAMPRDCVEAAAMSLTSRCCSFFVTVLKQSHQKIRRLHGREAAKEFDEQMLLFSGFFYLTQFRHNIGRQHGREAVKEFDKLIEFRLCTPNIIRNAFRE